FYQGSEKRMDNALHPELSKRIMNPSNGKLQNMSKERLVEMTANKPDEEPTKGKMKADITIYDITNDNATVKCVTDKFGFFDYCHLGKAKGEWKIINVLWGYPKK
ncbi:nuclear transport factor 2 family protein, partial [Bacteroidota bacterium]